VLELELEADVHEFERALYADFGSRTNWGRLKEKKLRLTRRGLMGMMEKIVVPLLDEGSDKEDVVTLLELMDGFFGGVRKSILSVLSVSSISWNCGTI